MNHRKERALHFLLSYLRNSIFLIFVLSSWFKTVAQTTNLKCEKYLVSKRVILKDEIFDRASLEVRGVIGFHYDAEKNLVMIPSSAQEDSVEICYRVLPTELLAPFYVRNRSTYSQVREYGKKPPSTNQQVAKPNIFEFNNVDMVGAISRGITVGNNQDLVVNSALNLQIDGKLSDELSIRANITDQNIPFQPEGNTQQIRDFDNVYIQLYGANYSLTAGDIVSTNANDDGYFLRYRKNVQGLSTKINYKINENWVGSSTGLISIAKGQFTSTSLAPIEGVQGPYRLRGANNERFIIVLANSEKVYVDGLLLERGFDRDYTIDYNQSEITFSNNILITRFSRIRVDFEYADQFYGRTNVNLSQSFQSEKSTFYLNFYQEKDNPNNPFGFKNDQENTLLLSLAGDNTNQAFISGIDSIGVQGGAILYSKVDTIVNDRNYEILVYKPFDEGNVYQASFTEVDERKGDYVSVNSTANGQIYQWIAPIDGLPQGNFIPQLRVNTPNKKQLTVLGASQKLSKFDKVYAELAISNTDLNLYSVLDDNDNTGHAYKIGYLSEGRPLLTDYKLDAEICFEHNAKNFQSIDRFRSIEYDRSWSYNSLNDTITRSDNIFVGKLRVWKKEDQSLSYEFSKRDREDVVDGYKHNLKLNNQFGDFLLRSETYYLNSETIMSQSEWFQNVNDIRFNRWSVQPGYQFVIDRHKESLGDSIRSSLMNFEAHNFYIETSDTTKIKTRIDFVSRQDRIPLSGELRKYTQSDELKWRLSTQNIENHKIKLNFTYRKVNEYLTNRTENNVLGLLSWNSHFLNKLISNTLQYSTSNARELRRSFVFIQVPSGQGTHTWRDENEDGSQDVNEFYLAVNIDEKEYVKIFTPTDEYINAFQTTYLQTLDIKSPKNWKEASSILFRSLAKLTFNMHLNINSKSTDNSTSRLNPFAVNASDTATIFLRSSRRFSFFYNRNAAGLAIDLTINNSDSKSLLSNGFELRERRELISNIRWPLSSQFVFRVRSTNGSLNNSSDFLVSRNYNISILGTEPTIVWQPSNKLRMTTDFRYNYKNSVDTEELNYSRITKIGSNLDIIRSGKGTINIGFEWINIDFKGEEQSALGYELLEALRPGSNQRWNVNWQQNIKSGLQLSVRYNGRNSESQRMIHSGSMSLTAFF
ncbi:MAG: hypothetical protein ACJA0X_000050 [Cyclobacteriaceae bacterium]